MTNKENANMTLWNSVDTTNPANASRISEKGAKLTAIDAYSQIKKATKLWGAFGDGWGVRDETFTQFGEGLDMLIVYQANLYYGENKNNIIPLASGYPLAPKFSKGQKMDSDCIKKVRTDALTKGLSMLGFNADIFMGAFDGNKYLNKPTPPSTKKGLTKEQSLQFKLLYEYLTAIHNSEDIAKQAILGECKSKTSKQISTSVFAKVWDKYKVEVEKFEKQTTGGA